MNRNRDLALKASAKSLFVVYIVMVITLTFFLTN